MKFNTIHRIAILPLLIVLWLVGCEAPEENPDPSTETKLVFKLEFDETQDRLDSFGRPASVPNGHGAQTPTFNLMGIHFIELSGKHDIPAYGGAQIFKSPVTQAGGDEAIDYEQALYADDQEDLFSINISDIPPGTYPYLRMSLSYQNYEIDFYANSLKLQGTVAAFVGVNTYIETYQIKDSTVRVNANKAQGYWAFEADFQGAPVIEGQAPEGATTVPNPISASSPIPIGSCLVTGIFDNPLVITGNETEDIQVTCSFSINNSFEWVDKKNNNKYEPLDGDLVIDMGIRGLKPSIGN